MEIENQLEVYIKKFELREKGDNALKMVFNNLLQSDEKVDGYRIDNLKSEYVRQEIRLLCQDAQNTIVARFNVFNGQTSDLPIGYYEYIVNYNGEFVDEFLVFK